MKKNILIIAFCLLCALTLNGQQTMIQADTIIANTGDSVNVPVYITNFNNIGSFTLFIEISNTSLSWGQALNWHPDVINGNPLVNAVGSTIILAWADVNGVSIGSGILVELQFHFNGEESDLIFTPACEVTDILGNSISPDPLYGNGRVAESVSVFVTASSTIICSGDNVQLNAVSSFGTGSYTYSWSSDPLGFSSSIQDPVVAPTTNTRYFVTVNDGIDSDTASVFVKISSIPAPVFTSLNMFPADSTKNLDGTISFSWSPADYASKYDFYIWVDSLPRPSTPYKADLTQLFYNYTGPKDYGISYKWQIVAKNNCFFTESPIYHFSVRHLPELHVSQVSTSQAFAGQPLTVSWTITNDGQGSTVEPLWYDRIWICPDVEVRIGEPEDILLATVDNLTYLPAGQSYTNTTQVNLPKGIEGSYFIFLIVDAIDAFVPDWTPAGGTAPIPYEPNVSGNPYPYLFARSHWGSTMVKEVNDNGSWCDNFFYVEIDVVLPPEPDLIVTSIIPPSNVFSGQPANVSWTVKNNGSVSASGNWTDAIYLSKDSILPDITQATLLGSSSYSGYLPSDSAYTKTGSFLFPSFEYGDHYVHVITDAGDQLYEGLFEGNNSKVSSKMNIFLTPTPDLKATVLNIPDSAFNKLDILVEWNVINQGATPTIAGNWYDDIFISDSPVFDSATAINLGKKIHYGNLEPDSSYISNMTVTIPEDISGLCYIYVYTDFYNKVFEHTANANNISRSDSSILILAADLTISNIQVPSEESGNQPVHISYSIKNNGPGDLLLSQFINKIYLSKYEAFDPDSVIQIGNTNSLSAIIAGDSIIINQIFNIPVTLSGNFYLFVFTDANNNIYEGANENNNILRSNSTLNIIRADLDVTDILFNPQAQSGSTIPIQWTVVNNGPGSILSSHWKDVVMISKAPNYQADSVIILDTVDVDTTIIAGGGYEKLRSFRLPYMLSGNYFIYVYTDAFDTIFENNIENNNILRSTAPVEITNPDLIVSDIDIPLSANSGSNITLSWTDKNIGNGDLKYGFWQDKLMLSPLPVYYDDSVRILGIKDNINTISTGDSLVINKNITIPNGISGNYYFFVHTDFGDTIYEGGNDNNNLRININPVPISLSPWIDLCPKSVILDDTVTAGEQIILTYTIKNQGYTSTAGSAWKDKIYFSSYNLLDTNAVLLEENTLSMTLQADSSYEKTVLINLPSDLPGGNCYFYVFTDADSNLYEYSFENNNSIRSSVVYLKQYPLDLAATSFIAVDTAWSGNIINITWAANNISHVPTLLNSWYDALYLSTDTIFDINTEIPVSQWQIFGPLKKSESYTRTKSVTIPNGLSGNYFMIMVIDHNNSNNDINPANNIALKSQANKAVPVYINLTPSPDLVVEKFEAPIECTSGQPFDVIFTIKNIGDGSTIAGSWTDKIFLSTDYSLDKNDYFLAAYKRNSDLDSNQSYTDTISITIPVWANGNFILIYNTDDNNKVYEHLGDSNNTKTEYILAIQPPATDLIVKDIIIPDSGVVGKPINIGWTVKNIGQNPAKGKMSEIVYLSSDTIIDIEDAILAQYQDNINLIPLAQTTRNINTIIPGVALGGYFVIVSTDVKNNIYESNDNNNASHSADSIYLDVNKLPFGVLTSDTLFNSTDLHYRVEVPDTLEGETMLSTMKADSVNGINEMYLRYNKSANRIDYDYSHAFPYQGNQEVVVPALEQGNYYMLLFGNTVAGNSQDINLLATILNFEIRNVSPSTASNRDKVTLEINGSKFVPLLQLWLQNTTDTIYPDTIIFVNRSKVFATFDLFGKNIGLYDVMAHNFCVGLTSLHNGFEIISGDKGRLGIDIVTPTTARPHRVTTFTIEYANIGHTDIMNPVIQVQSHTNAPIALNTDDLSLGLTEIEIPLQVAGEPANILRPGVTGTIIIYTFTTAGIGITIGSPNF